MKPAETSAANPFLFILGCPRSGTTLLERILDAHPQIGIATGGHGLWILNRFLTREGMTPAGLVGVGMAERKLVLDFMSQGEFAAFVLGLLADGASLSYASLIARISDRYARERGKPFVGYKVESTGHTAPSSVGRVPVLHGLWPQAKLLHILRDGRDVCLSVLAWRKSSRLENRFTTWRDDPVMTVALWWEWQVRRLRESGGVPAPEHREIRYESLVTQPEAECSAVCDFLGVPYDEAMLRFHSGRERYVAGLDAKHAWKPITPALRDWRREMAPDDIERFEAAAGELLDELGYPRGSSPPSARRREHALRLRDAFESCLDIQEERDGCEPRNRAKLRA